MTLAGIVHDFSNPLFQIILALTCQTIKTKIRLLFDLV
jgi:hypothetical protein